MQVIKTESAPRKVKSSGYGNWLVFAQVQEIIRGCLIDVPQHGFYFWTKKDALSFIEKNA